MGDTADIWQRVEPTIAAYATTVVYDRVGLGRSSKSVEKRTLEGMCNDLRGVLNKLDLTPPYLLVGHSLGGLLVRLYAASELSQVAGLVLIDAPHEHQTEAARKALSSEAWEMMRSFWLRSEEAIDLNHELAQIRTVASLENVPLTVLAATSPPALPPEFSDDVARELGKVATTIFPAFQMQLANTSKRGQLIKVEGAGHYLHWQRPDVVIAAIQAMILTM